MDDEPSRAGMLLQPQARALEGLRCGGRGKVGSGLTHDGSALPAPGPC